MGTKRAYLAFWVIAKEIVTYILVFVQERLERKRPLGKQTRCCFGDRVPLSVPEMCMCVHGGAGKASFTVALLFRRQGLLTTSTLRHGFPIARRSNQDQPRHLHLMSRLTP